jgi:hypothetical protein
MKSWALILSSAAIAAFACALPAQADQASDLAAIMAQLNVIQHD